MESMTFVLFGATGDLAKRKIFPALYNLFLDRKMPDAFSVIGLGTLQLSEIEFRTQVLESITTFSRRTGDDNSRLEQFLNTFCYSSLDAASPEDYTKLLQIVEQREAELNIPANRMFYLSVAPKLFDVITANLRQSGLADTKGWKRIIIEKPFGHDLSSAQVLNQKISQAFAEEEIYRIDHYLGKPMVQNLEALAFANPILQALWNNRYIANVQITASETVGVEERASYYDPTGAIRDMVQNHMLQLLMLMAMHVPNQITANHIRDEKRKIMNSLRPYEQQDVVTHVVRGQYGPGEINGRSVEGYTEEPGVDAASTTDTFVAARLWIDDAFWSGVPFYIRTGKRMREKSTKMVIEFKNPLANLYETEPNLLIININPKERVALQLNSKNVSQNGQIEPFAVDFTPDGQTVPEAYELLLFDALQGDSTYFAHWHEVEASWKWIQPLLDAFAANTLPIHQYPAGSLGPDAAQTLLQEDGFKWW